jgi:uncharacterized protein YaiI (UPF0178 family)
MSEPKSISQIIAELVSDPNSPVGQALLQCPCVKALLDAVDQDVVSTNGLNDWIDNQDVMLALHISQRTLQTLRSNGTLPYSRINNKIYYRRQDVEKILNDNYKMMKIRWHHGK